ncbi:ABC transporter-like protein [Neobacillus bataviensis LMG 21833]|uniref:ABC transporter-like protein n=1 Tax=Neobacillus bataviensis LMG 21833 TaxID=1117379 RepID=K6DAW2_9BACI|nr:ABC transporter ATP-binding protein [Neobacillus bataviensis]EKN65213.1 ABC transporter-like protein [Neobacillus bataviensis LMG 21833]
MLVLSNVSKVYKGNIALHNISLSIPKGEIVGILGSNGAGKSTLMNIITGYISMSSGDVLIDGMNILDEPDAMKGKIGYLPDTPPLYEEMTVYEYLLFVSKVKKLAKESRENEIQSKLEKLHLIDVQHRLIKNLSKGYKQRVGIAQAILGNPPLIVLDEPTVGLDPTELRNIRKVIKELRETSLVLISSHILSEINSVASYLVIMEKGELVTAGPMDVQSDAAKNLQHKLFIRIKGDSAKIQSILKHIEGVVSIEGQPDSEKECCDFSILYNPNIDIRETLFWELSKHELPILEMNLQGNSLEELFMQTILKKKGE